MIIGTVQETTAVEDVKDKSITEVAGSGNDDSKVEEPVVKDEKKEKVKKKRSFRSFSFLRREKKTKEENTKNGEVAKEVPSCFHSLFLNFLIFSPTVSSNINLNALTAQNKNKKKTFGPLESSFFFSLSLSLLNYLNKTKKMNKWKDEEEEEEGKKVIRAAVMTAVE